MSLCRWSSDDWQCELYVYGAEHGWTVHVAGNRFDPPEDFPRTPPYPEGIESQSPEFREWVGRVIECHAAQSRFFDQRGGYGTMLSPIGGAYDGDTFDGLDNEQLVDTLAVLRDAGYRFPDGVLEEAAALLAEEGADYAV